MLVAGVPRCHTRDMETRTAIQLVLVYHYLAMPDEILQITQGNCGSYIGQQQRWGYMLSWVAVW
jgi:hypothetical protein